MEISLGLVQSDKTLAGTPRCPRAADLDAAPVAALFVAGKLGKNGWLLKLRPVGRAKLSAWLPGFAQSTPVPGEILPEEPRRTEGQGQF